MPHEAAALQADSQSHIEGKSFSRLKLSGLTLSVPVEGGAARLKHRDADPLISEHGKWRKEHLGAFSAIYGRTPYYEHLMPEIAEVYGQCQGWSLERFNASLLHIALRWTGLNCQKGNMPHLPAGVAEEVLGKIDPEISIFDSIFRLGRETGLAFY